MDLHEHDLSILVPVSFRLKWKIYIPDLVIQTKRDTMRAFAKIALLNINAGNFHWRDFKDF